LNRIGNIVLFFSSLLVDRLGRVAASIAIAAIGWGAPVLAETATVRVGDAVKLAEESDGWAGVTTAIVAPGRNQDCLDGRILISEGYLTMSAKLDGSDRRIWRLPKASGDPEIHGETASPWIIHEQHMVSLRDGGVVQTVEAVTWNDDLRPHPAWWSWTQEYPLKGKSISGGRGTIYVYRTDDCGATWALISEIDAARLAVKEPRGIPTKDNPIATRGPFLRAYTTLPPTPGLCGTPRRYDVSDQIGAPPPVAKKSEAGGWDGHYLYFDPNTGVLVLTVRCACGTKDVGQHLNQELWIASRDGGRSWYVTRQTDQFGMFRMPVTSDGQGGVVTLYSVEGEGGPSFRLQRIASDFAPHRWLDYRDGPIIALQAPARRTADQKQAAQVETYDWAAPVLAPARGPGRGIKAGVGKWLNGTRLVYDVYRVDANGANAARIDSVTGLGADADALEAIFVDGPLDHPVDLFYWIERVPRQDGPDDSRIRFQIYAGEAAALAQPGTLTLAQGRSYTWGYKKAFIGEYMGGGSYIGADGTLHFVTPWAQNGALYMNTVALSPQSERAALAGRKLAIETVRALLPWPLSR
jgi:hypothetical protein